MIAADFMTDIPRDIAIAAHRGTSFSPERRGDQEIAGYAATLAADFKILSGHADTPEKQAQLVEEFARYRAGYRERYVARLSALSRCMSTMITGGSNFPTRRNAKANDRAEARTTDLIEFRERALSAIRKALHPEWRPIMAGDANASDRLAEKLDACERMQARMTGANAAIRKHAKAGTANQIAALVALGFSEGRARDLLTPDFMGRVGFAPYWLANNNAEIRRLKERTAKVATAKAAEVVIAEGERAKLEDDPAENRVRLIFPGKPDAEVRARLKRSGFRWAPSVGAWQAYRNPRALEIARSEAGIVPRALEIARSGQTGAES